MLAERGGEREDGCRSWRDLAEDGVIPISRYQARFLCHGVCQAAPHASPSPPPPGAGRRGVGVKGWHIVHRNLPRPCRASRRPAPRQIAPVFVDLIAGCAANYRRPRRYITRAWVGVKSEWWQREGRGRAGPPGADGRQGGSPRD